MEEFHFIIKEKFNGRFEIDKKDLSIAYRGSSNQKIYKKINNVFIDKELIIWYSLYWG